MAPSSLTPAETDRQIDSMRERCVRKREFRHEYREPPKSRKRQSKKKAKSQREKEKVPKWREQHREGTGPTCTKPQTLLTEFQFSWHWPSLGKT